MFQARTRVSTLHQPICREMSRRITPVSTTAAHIKSTTHCKQSHPLHHRRRRRHLANPDSISVHLQQPPVHCTTWAMHRYRTTTTALRGTRASTSKMHITINQRRPAANTWWERWSKLMGYGELNYLTNSADVLPCSPYGSVAVHPPQSLSHHHHHHLSGLGSSGSSVIIAGEHLQHQMSSSPTNEGTITVLESGPSGRGELKKVYSHQHHDLNNNGHLYQNLPSALPNNIKSESHSPIDGTSKALESNELPSNELSSDTSSERSRCWTKI